MAKYVCQIPGRRDTDVKPKKWGPVAVDFVNNLRDKLSKLFGFDLMVFEEEDGAELSDGCMGMGKDWFNFRFRVFAAKAIYLDMLNVPMEHRDKGVGYYIVDELKNFAKENGLEYIFLGSYEPANPFWEKCGFVKVTEYPDFVVDVDEAAK